MLDNMTIQAKLIMLSGSVWAIMLGSLLSTDEQGALAWMLCAAALLVAVSGGWMLAKRQSGRLARVRHDVEQIIDEKWQLLSGTSGNDEIGKLIKAVQLLSNKFQVKFKNAAANNVVNVRNKSALDSVTANVMMADENFNIVYANHAVIEMLRDGEADIRKELTGFSASKVLGANIDIFHKNPSHQRRMVSELRSVYRNDIVVGGRTYGLIATPLFEGEKRLGTVVEWTDKTAQLKREAEEQARAAQERKSANESSRIKSALDVVTANVMMADDKFNIVYANDAVLEMLRDGESDIRKELHGFSVSKVLGGSIDQFHKNPEHQRRMVEGLRDTYRNDITVGGRTYGLIATPVFNDNNERLGTVVEWTDKTEQLKRDAEEKARVSQERKVAAENQRIKQALDAVTTNVMLADDKNNIVYMNSAIKDMLGDAQNDIRKQLHNFDVSKLMGANMDTFHKNPAHQQRMISGLTTTFKTEIEVGGRTFSLVANPVFDKEGERLGTAVEWKDRTEEVAVEKEVENIVAAAAGGDLGQRISMEGKQGFFRSVGEGINQLTSICDSVIQDTVRVLSAMSQGDLTKRISADYHGSFGQLKQDANSTAEKFIEIISEIQSSADTVQSGANEISAGNQSLSQRTEEQASSLEETASSMEEMTGTIKQNADNANQANQLASSARNHAEQGGQVVGKAVGAMEEINRSSKKVADIIGVIDEIAFQTNLLALNAAVEAARAGEQGRGFAVVASEVRNLAQRSATAAKEIKDLIKDSVSKVEEGGKLVDDTGKTLEEIVSAVKKVSDIIAEIAAASHEQASGIDQVNKAVMQLDEMTQQNAALVEEAAATSESMASQADNMNRLMGFFNTGVQRSAAKHTSQPQAVQPQERRGTQRPFTPPKAVPSAPTVGKKTGTNDDEWDEF